MTLLKKAMKVKKSNPGRKPLQVTNEELDLILAYARGEVSLKQVKEAIDICNDGLANDWIKTRAVAAMRQKLVVKSTNKTKSAKA